MASLSNKDTSITPSSEDLLQSYAPFLFLLLRHELTNMAARTDLNRQKENMFFHTQVYFQSLVSCSLTVITMLQFQLSWKEIICKKIKNLNPQTCVLEFVSLRPFVSKNSFGRERWKFYRQQFSFRPTACAGNPLAFCLQKFQNVWHWKFWENSW